MFDFDKYRKAAIETMSWENQTVQLVYPLLKVCPELILLVRDPKISEELRGMLHLGKGAFVDIDEAYYDVRGAAADMSLYPEKILRDMHPDIVARLFQGEPFSITDFVEENKYTFEDISDLNPEALEVCAREGLFLNELFLSGDFRVADAVVSNPLFVFDKPLTYEDVKDAHYPSLIYCANHGFFVKELFLEEKDHGEMASYVIQHCDLREDYFDDIKQAVMAMEPLKLSNHAKMFLIEEGVCLERLVFDKDPDVVFSALLGKGPTDNVSKIDVSLIDLDELRSHFSSFVLHEDLLAKLDRYADKLETRSVSLTVKN